MIFFHTCSQDVTTDLILAKLSGRAESFRFDVDRWREFSWDFGPRGWSCTAPGGERIGDSTMSCFHLRKPMFLDAIHVPAHGSLENWCRREILDLFKNLYSASHAAGIAALVAPDGDAWGKLRQMKLAERFFPVPEWHLFTGRRSAVPADGRWVVKSLTQTMIGEGKCFLVREADLQALDPSYPWFVQRRIDGGDEVSAAFVNGRIWASSISRDVLGADDARLETFRRNLKWTPCELADSEREAICGFMREAGLSFGRFDFIRQGGALHFLEVNPNGQWAWLDENDERGLVSAVAGEILAVERRGRTLAAAFG